MESVARQVPMQFLVRVPVDIPVPGAGWPLPSGGVREQLASRGGLRLRLRYLGTARNNVWLKRRTAALDLRNLIRRGLTREHGTWVLA
jgi:hypothetical protein